MAAQVSFHSEVVGALGHGLASVMDPPLSPATQRQQRLYFPQQQPEEPAAEPAHQDAAAEATAEGAAGSIPTPGVGVQGEYDYSDQFSSEMVNHDHRESEDAMPASTTTNAASEATSTSPSVNDRVQSVSFPSNESEGDGSSASSEDLAGEGAGASINTTAMTDDVDMSFFDESGLISMATDEDLAATTAPAVTARVTATSSLGSGEHRRRSVGSAAVGLAGEESLDQTATLRRGSVSGGVMRQSDVIGSSASRRRRRLTVGGVSGTGAGGGGGLRLGLSRKFVRSLMRHLNLRADARQREELRSMVETLRYVASRPGVDMKQELKREAVSLLGPELAREAFEASLSETRNEFYRQRTVAAAAAEAAASTEALGGGRDAAAAAAEAAAAAAASALRRRESGLPPLSFGARRGSGGGGGGSFAPASGSISAVGSLPRAEARPPPRKRRSFGGGGWDSPDGSGSGEEDSEAAPGGSNIASFFEMPAEEIEQRLKAIHKGPLHEDFHLCCVCMAHPRNAALIHGKTAHQACCYECASELFERGLPCPFCRQPIAHVVRNFL